ncbi:MAG: hypothetical protein AAFV62_12145 [Pseudomonadota bacterium]
MDSSLNRLLIVAAISIVVLPPVAGSAQSARENDLRQRDYERRQEDRQRQRERTNRLLERDPRPETPGERRSRQLQDSIQERARDNWVRPEPGLPVQGDEGRYEQHLRRENVKRQRRFAPEAVEPPRAAPRPHLLD